MTRETAGAFTARRVAELVPLNDFSSAIGLDLPLSIDPFDAPPLGSLTPSLEAGLAADGRVVLAWPAPAGARPLVTSTVRTAVGGLDGRFERPQTLGSPVRNVADLAALFTGDGRAAVAWADNTSRATRGRLHVAVEGAPEQSRPAPRLRVRARPGQRLYPSERVRLLVSCGSACDLRTTVLGLHGPSDATAVTRRAGRHAIAAGTAGDLRPGRRRRVRVVVHATAPGGSEIAMRSLRVPVVALRSLPVIAPRDVRARRDGDSIVVTWRTAKPARRQWFVVIGARRGLEDVDTSAYALREGGGRKRFRVRLRPDRPAGVRVVTVLAESYDSGEDGPTRTVRVR